MMKLSEHARLSLLGVEGHPLTEWEPHSTGDWSIKCCRAGSRNARVEVLGHGNAFERLKEAPGHCDGSGPLQTAALAHLHRARLWAKVLLCMFGLYLSQAFMGLYYLFLIVERKACFTDRSCFCVIIVE